MRRRVLNQDFLAGWLLLGFGILGLWLGAELEAGTAARMGAGYFPRLVSGALCIFGLLTVARGWLVHDAEVGRLALRPLAVILGAVVLFGVVLADLGLPAATAMLVLLTGLASSESRIAELLALAVALAFFSVAVFVRLLGMTFKVWPG